MKRKLNIWDWLFYGSMLTLSIWLILKIVGIIQTPFWLEYGIPVGTAMIALASFYQQLLDSFYNVKTDVLLLKNQFVALNSKVDKIDEKVEFLDEKVDHLDKDIELVKRKISVC